METLDNFWTISKGTWLAWTILSHAVRARRQVLLWLSAFQQFTRLQHQQFMPPLGTKLASSSGPLARQPSRVLRTCGRMQNENELSQIAMPSMCDRGVRKQPVQFVDARDLAEWTIRVAEQRTTGEFNASGPFQPITMRQMLVGIAQGDKDPSSSISRTSSGEYIPWSLTTPCNHVITTDVAATTVLDRIRHSDLAERAFKCL
jgi:hypothetical protein